MDDLHDRLERLANRIEDRAEPLTRLQRVRAHRARTRRLSAATLALVVGVAGILGVVRAFDDVGGRTPQRVLTWRPPDVLTIWPEGPSRHITVDLADVQAAVDSGDASLQWRTDPREVALRFAKSVLSWDVRSVVDQPAEFDPASGGSVRSFLLGSCPADAACYFTHIEEVNLVQSARQGEGGIWSVGWVIGDVTSPELDPGSRLTESGLIRFSPYHYGRSVKPIFGLEWFNGCIAGRTAQKVGDEQPTISLSTLSNTLAEEGCSSVAAGVAYSVRSEERFEGTIDLVDPFAGGATDISAVPFTFDLPADPLADGASTKVYTDPLGWSIDHPADWYVHPIDWTDSRLTISGAAFSNEPIVPVEGEPLPDVSQLSHDGVMLWVLHHGGGIRPRASDDSEFPLSADDRQIIPGPSPIASVIEFSGDGLPFTVQWGGFADGDPTNHSALDRMVESLRFEPWTVGERRNGWDALGSASDFATGVFEWRELDGGDWLLIGPGERREAFGYVTAPCPAPELSGTELVGLMRCPDGSDNGWNARAEPLPGNDPNYAVPLERFPVITSWDGYLLIGFGYPGCQGVCE